VGLRCCHKRPPPEAFLLRHLRTFPGRPLRHRTRQGKCCETCVSFIETTLTSRTHSAFGITGLIAAVAQSLALIKCVR